MSCDKLGYECQMLGRQMLDSWKHLQAWKGKIHVQLKLVFLLLVVSGWFDKCLVYSNSMKSPHSQVEMSAEKVDIAWLLEYGICGIEQNGQDFLQMKDVRYCESPTEA